MGHISGAALLKISSEFAGLEGQWHCESGVVGDIKCLAKSHILSGLCGDAQQVSLSDQTTECFRACLAGSNNGKKNKEAMVKFR